MKIYFYHNNENKIFIDFIFFYILFFCILYFINFFVGPRQYTSSSFCIFFCGNFFLFQKTKHIEMTTPYLFIFRLSHRVQ